MNSSLILLLLFGDSVVVVPSVPGIEVDETNKLHYSLTGNRLHYDDCERLHYSLTEERLHYDDCEGRPQYKVREN